MICCIFGWYFYIEIRLKYEKKICCPALELFHCLPLWKTVRLHGKKLQNATKENVAGLSYNDFERYYWKSRALHQHASSSKSHFIILDFCSTLILCGIYWTAVLWSLFLLALSTFCQKVCTIKPGRSGICFSRAYWNRSYEILSNTCYLNIFTNLFRQRY